MSNKGFGMPRPRRTYFLEKLCILKNKLTYFWILHVCENIIKHIRKPSKVMFQVVLELQEYDNHIRHAFLMRIDRVKHDFDDFLYKKHCFNMFFVRK